VKIGVLALQGDVREHLRALAICDAAAQPVRRPGELDDVDALVIPGGESTTISKLSVEFGLLEPIRKRIGDGMPVYGSCAGMIMLAAEVLDGRPGRQVDSFEADLTLAGVPGQPFHAVFIRAPWVERIGPGVEVLGRVPVAGSVPDGADGRIVAVRQGNLLATAFHPELAGDLRVHRRFVELVRDAQTRVAEG